MKELTWRQSLWVAGLLKLDGLQHAQATQLVEDKLVVQFARHLKRGRKNALIATFLLITGSRQSQHHVFAIRRAQRRQVGCAGEEQIACGLFGNVTAFKEKHSEGFQASKCPTQLQASHEAKQVGDAVSGLCEMCM